MRKGDQPGPSFLAYYSCASPITSPLSPAISSSPFLTLRPFALSSFRAFHSLRQPLIDAPGEEYTMPTLWGRDWTREELEARVGDMRQVAGVRLVELGDGRERGARAAQFHTGTGFRFLVLIDRGLDISQADYCGRALAWQSMTGD